jgi:sec-independent protein translocase protein TatC
MPLDQVDVDVMEDRESAEMTFMDHIDTLRKHIVRSGIAFVVCFIAAFLAKEIVFDGIIFAPTRNDFFTYRALCWLSHSIGLGDSMCLSFKAPITLINTEMSGQFMMHMQVSAVLGFILAFPFIFWQIWSFVKPGLHRKEVKYTQGIILFTSSLFLLGVAFGYYIMTPFSVHFFADYKVSEAVNNTFTLTIYISFLTMFSLLSGRHASVILLVVAAVITPGGLDSQLMVFVPIFLLYEISIFISARVIRNMERDEE